MLEFFENIINFTLTLGPLALALYGFYIKSSKPIYFGAILSIPYSIGPTPVTLIIPLMFFLSGYFVNKHYVTSIVFSILPFIMFVYVFAYVFLI